MLGEGQSLDEVVRRSATMSGEDELWTLLLDHLRSKGLRAVAQVNAMGVRGGRPPRSDGFGDWADSYMERHVAADPAMRRAGLNPAPCLWSEIDAGSPDVVGTAGVSAAKRYLDDLRSFGEGDGLFFPLWGPSARKGYVLAGFGGPAPAIPPEVLAGLHAVLLGLNARVTRTERPTGARRLSPRENEVLLWIARGHSNVAIAEQLQVSYHTIDTMVRRIFAKLDATDRTSATVRGLSTGIIELEEVAR